MRKVFRSNLFFLSLILMQIISFIVIALITYLRGVQISSTSLLITSSLACIFLPIVVFFIITKLPVKETLKLNKMNKQSVFLSIIIGFLFIPIGAFCSIVTSLWFDNNVVDVMNTLSSSSAMVFILILSIMPAIGEELAMRGIVLSGYANVSIHKSAFLTGFLFAVLHLNPPQFLYAFLLGALLAYLVYYTNSIFSSIIVHFVFNGTNSISFLMQSANNSEALKAASSADITTSVVFGFFIFALICSIAIIYLLRKIKNININNIGMHVEHSNSHVIETTKKEVSALTAYLPIIISVFIFIVFAFIL